jgi:hypothetical protein
MKYCINHYDHFESVYPPFVISFLSTFIAIIVEINVMIILSSIQDVVAVCLKFASLTAIVNIPRQYYGSIQDHRLLACGGYDLKITKLRKDSPLEFADTGVLVLRVIYKSMRMMFCAWSFYFMPFGIIFLNFRFMIGDKYQGN